MHTHCVKERDLAPICVLACSPRQGGNSDAIAQLFADGVHSVTQDKLDTPQVKILYLRNFNILSCIGCDACHHSSRCIYEGKDDVAYLFSCMQRASYIFFASPIYFYHIPAKTKAFMDRAQQFWGQHLKHKAVVHTEQSILHDKAKAGVALVAARKQGENLFQGSLWSLQYFFDVFSVKITDKLLFPGFDGAQELLQDTATCQQIYKHGQNVATVFLHNNS